jgi:hypothetical protein
MKYYEFNFELRYRGGLDMIIPDALSMYIAGATVSVPVNSKLRWDTHLMLGHRGVKVVL